MKNLDSKKGIRLDIGCGRNKQPGFTGMDIRRFKTVDIVHDLTKIPYPLPDESCIQIIGSHIVEHIDPKDFGFIKFMDELWRITKPGCQVAFAYPYGVNHHFQKDPTHINPCNQTTWWYFDPGYSLYDVYTPKPWFIVSNLWQETGQGEVLIQKLTVEEGKNRLKLRKKASRLEKKVKKKREKEEAKQRQLAMEKTLENLRKDKVTQDLTLDITPKNLKPGIIRKQGKTIHRLMYGVPMTGLIRSEWAFARYNQITPCNWSKLDIHQWLDQWSPLGHTVADARNIIATAAVEKGFEWVFFHDHDVVLPQGTLLMLNEHMIKRKVPVVCGIYFTKSMPSEPLIYRDLGNAYYDKWKFGDQVEVGFVHMGCTLIHGSLLEVMYNESRTYNIGGMPVKKIFETPAKVWYDKDMNSIFAKTGTEDIHWSERVVKDNIFEKAGWPEYQAKEYPFICDTNLYCKHISFDGVQYPSSGEDMPYEPHRLNQLLELKNDSKDTMV